MKIAIDNSPLKTGDKIRGVGTYTRQLIAALVRIKSKKYEVFDLDISKEDIKNYDLIHLPYFQPYFLTLPANLLRTKKFVVTVHDTIPLIYPDKYPPGIKGKFRLMMQKRNLAKAEIVITVSETSKKDIVRFLGIPQEKIIVIHEAPRPIFKKIKKPSNELNILIRKYSLPSKFVLYVGDVNYNKNLFNLAQACMLAGIPLVIVGKQAKDEDFDRQHPENASFLEFLGKYGEDPNIIRLGYLSDSDLVGAYNLATVYCQPSFYEGFGLPVLEAMACGVPVIISKTNALVETATNAALAVEPKDTKDMAEKIKRLVRDSSLRAELIRKGNTRVKNFSWKKTAKETFKVYKRVLNNI